MPSGYPQGSQRGQFILRIAIAAALVGFQFGCETAMITAAVSAIQSNIGEVFYLSGTGSVPEGLVLGMQMSLVF